MTKTTLQPKGKPAVIPAPVTTSMVSAKRNDDVKVKTYFLFEAKQGSSELHNSAMDMPRDVRNILASFALNIALRIKAKIVFNHSIHPIFDRMFNDVPCEEMENDYEDLAENAACPLCGMMIDAPYNYVEVVIGKNLNMVFSLRLLVHLLNEHEFSVPGQFASLVFSKFFNAIPVIKLPTEMTREELLDEINTARAANESLAEAVSKMQEQLAALMNTKAPVAKPEEITIDLKTGMIAEPITTAPPSVSPVVPLIVAETIWDEVKKEVGDPAASKSGDDGDDSADEETTDEAATEDTGDADEDDDSDSDESEGEADESSQEEDDGDDADEEDEG
jgi:hypothetical protein